MSKYPTLREAPNEVAMPRTPIKYAMTAPPWDDQTSAFYYERGTLASAAGYFRALGLSDDQMRKALTSACFALLKGEEAQIGLDCPCCKQPASRESVRPYYALVGALGELINLYLAQEKGEEVAPEYIAQAWAEAIRVADEA